jgi:hypothetical protein
MKRNLKLILPITVAIFINSIKNNILNKTPDYTFISKKLKLQETKVGFAVWNDATVCATEDCTLTIDVFRKKLLDYSDLVCEHVGDDCLPITFLSPPLIEYFDSIDKDELSIIINKHKEYTIYEIPVDGFGVLDSEDFVELTGLDKTLKKYSLPDYQEISYNEVETVQSIAIFRIWNGIEITEELKEKLSDWKKKVEEDTTFGLILYKQNKWGTNMPKLPFSVLNLPGLPITNKNFIKVSDAVYNHEASQNYFNNINVKYYTNTYRPRFELIGHYRRPLAATLKNISLTDLKGMKVGVLVSALNFNLYKVIFEYLYSLGMYPIKLTSPKDLLNKFVENNIQAAALPFSQGFIDVKIPKHWIGGGWYTNNLCIGMSNSPIVIENDYYNTLKNGFDTNNKSIDFNIIIKKKINNDAIEDIKKKMLLI